MTFAKIFERILKFFGARLMLGLITAILALLIFFWLAEEVFEGETKVFDEHVRAAIHQIASPTLTAMMKIASTLGSVLFLVALGICMVIVFIRLRWKRAVALFVITMTGEIILDLTLKLLFRRIRPEPFFDYPLPSSYSFPSGHALASFCFYGILTWLITARLQNRHLKFLIWTLAILLIFFIGFSRIYLGVHFPSDVIAGYLTATIWVVVIALGDFFFDRRKDKS